ncbi:unnamed protein product [Soboliphyme baturini]|uniref:peptidylglycine monooxygenase n=1 Tax=Soboliphyme baturini TaxID=241478 RepID=A0A183ISY6_9BILA|nr:unnamed protein product [Soboliphyme baturini]
MILFGCSKPNHPTGGVWDCEHHSVCDKENPKILFSWARNAPSLSLPDNVGVAVGGDSGIDNYVVQVHYNAKFTGEVLDYSGVVLNVTSLKPRYFADVLLMVSSAYYNIPPHMSEVALNISCTYYGPTPLHIFAYRTHAHSLGRIITGYNILNDQWTLIGKGNPQWPQRFYPTTPEVVAEPGSILAAQCIFNSTTRDTVTYIGAHGKNEMCNFYMYIYVESEYGTMLKQLGECLDSNDTKLFAKYPAEARKPLERNPLLEMEANMTMERFGEN